MQNKVEICSKALLLIGTEGINSFDDPTAEASLCRNMYEHAKEQLLTLHPWRFSIIKGNIEQEAGVPNDEFKFQYRIPSGALILVSVSDIAEPWDLFNGKLLTHHNAAQDGSTGPLTGEWQINVKEQYLPAYFIEALVYDLAHRYSVPITESVTKSQWFKQLYEQHFMTAKNLDAKQRPAQPIVKDGNLNRYPLTAVR